MKLLLHTLILAVLSVSGLSAADKPAVEGAEPGAWTMDLDAARKVAAAKKLPLLLNFTGSDWCGWCKLMDKQVFSQPLWQSYASANLMLVWIDFPNDKSLVPEKFVARNKALSEQYGVEGFPTYVVLDDDGKSELGRLGADRGATPEQFISQAKALLQARASVVEALLKTVPAAAAEEYRATNKELAGARAELKELEAAFEKKSQALREQIEKQDRRLADIRTEARLSALPKEKADQYRAKQKRLSAAQDELKAWIATGPARNEENQKKHAGWRDEIGALEKDMRQLLGD